MSETKELFREDIRNDHYYGGELYIVVDDSDFEQRPYIEWEAYSGGTVRLRLDWDELKRLAEAAVKAREHKPEWWA